MPPLSVAEAQRLAVTAFAKPWPKPLAARLGRELLASILKRTAAWIAGHGDASIDAAAATRLQNLLERAAQGEPLASLTGEAIFRGTTFRVSPHTLIPRPETEDLVDLILERWSSKRENVLAVDIGTGTGCIGLSLALERGPGRVLLTDTSKQALAVARKNADALLGKQAGTVERLQTPLFSNALERAILRRTPSRLMVAANLPYLPRADQKRLSRSVLAYEPAKALFGGQNGDELVRKLIRQLAGFAKRHPEIAVDICCEFDPPQARGLRAYAKTLFPEKHIEIHEDGFGRERFLCLWQP